MGQPAFVPSGHYVVFAGAQRVPQCKALGFSRVRALTQARSRFGSGSLGLVLDAASAMTSKAEQPPPQNRLENRARQGGAGTATDQIVVIGLSHHTASVDLRERLAVPESEWKEAAAVLVEACPSVSEVALLSTCNRFEVYLTCGDTKHGILEVTKYLSQRSGIEIHELRQHLFMLTEEDAIWHLLRVASGLDSLVVGEGQILAQVKRCYEIATENGGMAGKLLTRLFNAAVSAGKRVRTETGIAKGAVSISSAAVELMTVRYTDDILGCSGETPQIESNCLATYLAKSRVCIVGAGTMSRLLVTHLLARGVTDITIVNRSLERAHELLKQFPDVDINVRPLTELIDAIVGADVVFTSTSSREPVLTADMLGPHLEASESVTRSRIFIDISVPRNIAENVSNLSGAHVYNVDDLKAVVARNQLRRRRLIIEAENLLREELRQFRNWQSSLGCIPAITKLQDRAEEIRLEELSKVTGKLSDLTDKEREVVERLTKGIVNKLLHGPLSHLRGLQDVEERRETIKNLESMFRL
ncbi:GTP-binding protein gtr1 [Cyanidiococcus yangmingshanensis]|uniref:Glutamyl-tRNA reductase n=1 Tax=Cyanidiococcus yangmingshanensis TaxID=2690220 RepID=A0A7J7IN29_9RHOD|nr:GTP-binding protein gtr1 [Cyanidiococcus yangmingshanensis]